MIEETVIGIWLLVLGGILLGSGIAIGNTSNQNYFDFGEGVGCGLAVASICVFITLLIILGITHLQYVP